MTDGWRSLIGQWARVPEAVLTGIAEGCREWRNDPKNTTQLTYLEETGVRQIMSRQYGAEVATNLWAALTGDIANVNVKTLAMALPLFYGREYLPKIVDG